MTKLTKLPLTEYKNLPEEQKSYPANAFDDPQGYEEVATRLGELLKVPPEKLLMDKDTIYVPVGDLIFTTQECLDLYIFIVQIGSPDELTIEDGYLTFWWD